MSMAITDTATPASEARAALLLLNEVDAEIARLRGHLARLASTEPIDTPALADHLAIAWQARRSAKTVTAMVKGIERDASRAVQIAEQRHTASSRLDPEDLQRVYGT